MKLDRGYLIGWYDTIKLHDANGNTDAIEPYEQWLERKLLETLLAHDLLARENKSKMKLLIFKSQTTRAVYSWNGKQVGTIVGAEKRPIGKIMKGIPNDILDKVYKSKSKKFKVGEAIYSILKRS